MSLRSGFLIVSERALGRPVGLRCGLSHGAWVTPQPGEIVGGGGQRHFDRHLRQAAQAEAAHPALFFQPAHHRFDGRFAPLVGRPAHRIAQLAPRPSRRKL